MTDKRDKRESRERGSAKSLGAVPFVDGLISKHGVKAPTKRQGNAVTQPRELDQVKEVDVTAKKVDDMLFTWKQTFAIISIFVVASGVFISVGFDAFNARFDDVNARFDRVEDRIDERFDELETRIDGLESRFDDLEIRFDELDANVDDLEAKVDANSMLTARLEGKRILTFGSSN